ncbi:MAG: VCBS repeat-containing protein [Deltaproteobacteria bacterium]|nr:VCBS repeat-containing protein [Deltaproteobacteria bacterium]
MKQKHTGFLLAALILLILILLTLIQAPPSYAKKAEKVAVLPFAMHAERDLSFLREGILDMLASRLFWKDKVMVIEKRLIKRAMKGHQGPITPEYATELAGKLNADYVLYGSLTIFAQSVSMDATMASLKKKKPPVTVFVQTKGMEAVIPEINKFAQKVNAKIFGRPYMDTEFAYIPQGAYGKPVDGRASPLNPAFVKYHQVNVQDNSFWKSKRFQTEIQGMDIGDVTGDGQNEIVLLEGTHLSVYRYEDGVMIRIGSYRSADHHRFIAVDVADINGNGRAEVFASKVSKTTVTSVVLEMEGNVLRPIIKRSSWLYRVMDWPGRGKILVGQEIMAGGAGGYSNLIRDYFSPGIFALTWEGSTYDKAEEEPLQNLSTVYIYNFSIGDLGGDPEPEIVMIDRSDRLHILDNAGEEMHKTSENYGGTLNYIITNPPGSGAGAGGRQTLDEQWLYIPARILIVDLDKNGKNEIIINQNKSSVFGLSPRFQAFSDGKIVSLSWTGLALDPNWESRKLSGCLSSYHVRDLDNDGNPDLVVSLLQQRGAKFFQKARSLVVSYKLKMKEEEEE